MVLGTAENSEAFFKILPDGSLLPVKARDQAPDCSRGLPDFTLIPNQIVQVVFQILLLDEEVIEVSQVVLQLFQLADKVSHVFFGEQRCKEFQQVPQLLAADAQPVQFVIRSVIPDLPARPDYLLVSLENELTGQL